MGTLTRLDKIMRSVGVVRLIARALRGSDLCVRAFEAAEGFPCEGWYGSYGESCLACPMRSRASIEDVEEWLLGEVD